MSKVNPAQFVRQVRQEVAKVSWPSRKETGVGTLMVFIMVFLAAIFFLLDARIEIIFSTLVADYVVKGFLYVARFKSDKWMNVLKIKEAD